MSVIPFLSLSHLTPQIVEVRSEITHTGPSLLEGPEKCITTLQIRLSFLLTELIFSFFPKNEDVHVLRS